MDLRKLRPGDLLRPAMWQRGWYSLRDQLRATPEATTFPDVEVLYSSRNAQPPRPRQLRVLYVAPRYDYGNPRRGLGIEENYFLHALVAMGHEVVRFDAHHLGRQHGRELANRMLADAVDRYDPDLLFAVMFREELDPDVVAGITRRLGGRTVNWFCDDQWRFDSYSARWAPRYGWVATTAAAALPRYRSIGVENVILTQWACNHFLYKPIEGETRFDVSFVGQPHGDRADVIGRLRRAGIKVTCFGYGWPAGRISQGEMIRVFSSSLINLNLSNASTGKLDQVKGRDFEVPGCRGFLISKRNPELAKCYEEGSEMEMYGDVDELVDKIRYYLEAHGRRKEIAQSGYERTLREHTMERRLTTILQRVVDAD
jgi:spore maturation protein CgeB